MRSILQWFRPGPDAARQNPTKHGERKSSLSPFVALHSLTDTGWPVSGYHALAREGFARNPVVYRCVRMIAEAAASMQWLLYEGKSELDNHPLLKLLDHPNGRMAGQTFVETLYGHLLISGNAYIQIVSLDNTPRELHLLRPDKVRPVPDENGWPGIYEYEASNRKYRLDASGSAPQILHFALFNPLNEIEGLPPLHAARMSLEIHNSACRWNKSLLENSATPSGALVYTASDGANLTDDQFDRLKMELEEGYAGASRAGRPMVLEGGLDWKAMGLTPRDMDFIEAKNGSAREIALAFGVPPMLLGIPGDNTYSNYQEANRAFWRMTVLPMASRIAGMLSGCLSKYYDANLRLDFDRDRIEALAPDRDLLWARLEASTFLTLDEKREAAGYGPADPGLIATKEI